MAGLASEIKRESEKSRTGRIDSVLERLDAEDREALIQCLEDHSISPTAIVRVLKVRGIDLDRNRVIHYREKTLRDSEKRSV